MARWGKAGVRLTQEEIAASNIRAMRHRQDEEVAFKLWRSGQVRPYRITMALDARQLYGPQVDEACGAQEPDVDLWEAGKLYPTWRQVQLLAKLCGVTPRFFTEKDRSLPILATTMRFHMSAAELKELESEPPPAWEFPADVVAATVGKDAQ